MRLWRISQRKSAVDRSCIDTAQFGGRWNPIGIPALYCGTSIAICTLEKFVHVGAAPMPPLVLVAVDIPDDSTVYAPAIDELPIGWNAMPTSKAAQEFGRVWLAKGAELGMSVLSVIVPEERNMVINPRHSDYRNVELTVVRPFAFDGRMFK